MTTTRLSRVLTALRPSTWDIDRVVVALNGWILDSGRLGRVVVRDPRFDRLRDRGTGEPLDGDQAATVRASITTGRWL